MDFNIRPARQDEIPALDRALGWGFGSDPVPEEQDHFDAPFLERTRCVFDGVEMVGTCGAYSLELAVPGGTLETAGTTIVSVRASHRRRGLLRAMMRDHLRDVEERGEPLAALWASESSIYSRFGYGPAADIWRFEVERAHAVFAAPLEAAGRCRQVELPEAEKILPDVYDQLWRDRPGHFARSPIWWEHRHLRDPERERGGASAYRYVIYEEEERPRGYLQYRVKQNYDPAGLPRSVLRVMHLEGLDAAARGALWLHAFEVDLIEKVLAWNQPADCELPWLLADRRRAVSSPRDALWVRLHDIPAALAGRRYAAEGRVVFGVRDAFWPGNSGSYALETGPDGAACRRTSEDPEIQLDTCDLGSVYLGGHRLRTLARAGRVEGSQLALERADAMLGWDPAPWCPEIF